MTGVVEAAPATGERRNTPYERVAFEYRIDRKPRILKRSHMFPNAFHPRGMAMTDDIYVCNSVHTNNLRAGLVSLAPGAESDFPIYPNEHFLLHLSGAVEWRVGGKTYRPDAGDEIFTPAFIPYQVANIGLERVWLLSCYLRITDWVGVPASETLLADGCHEDRFLVWRECERRQITEGWHEIDGLKASRNRSAHVFLDPGAGLQPQHRFEEQLIMPLDGETRWHLDGIEYLILPHDMLFIPALFPFSCVNIGDGPAHLVRYEIMID